MDAAAAKGGEGLDADDDKDEPAENAVCAFVANNLHKESNPGSLEAPSAGLDKEGKK